MRRNSIALLCFSIIATLVIIWVSTIKAYGADVHNDNSVEFVPYHYPNSIWICAEKNICFIVDNAGKVCGVSQVQPEFKFFNIVFEKKGRGGTVFAMDSIESNHAFFSGIVINAEYYENKCTLSYLGEDDKYSLWGEEENRVTLNFYRKNLMSPVAFVEGGYSVGHDVILFGEGNGFLSQGEDKVE